MSLFSWILFCKNYADFYEHLLHEIFSKFYALNSWVTFFLIFMTPFLNLLKQKRIYFNLPPTETIWFKNRYKFLYLFWGINWNFFVIFFSRNYKFYPYFQEEKNLSILSQKTRHPKTSINLFYNEKKNYTWFRKIVILAFCPSKRSVWTEFILDFRYTENKDKIIYKRIFYFIV